MKRKKLFVILCLLVGSLSLQAKEFVKIKKSLFKSDDREGYKDAAYDDSLWLNAGDKRARRKVQGPTYWLRFHLYFNQEVPEKTLAIDSAIFSGAGELYLNGHLIGNNNALLREERFYLKERVYELPSRLIKRGEMNVLAIKLTAPLSGMVPQVDETELVAPYSELLRAFYLREFGRLLLILLLIFIAFNLLRGFFERKTGEAYLLLSLCMILTSIFLLISLNIYPPLFGNTDLAARIRFISLMGICPAFTLFLLNYFKRRVNIAVTFYIILHILFMLVFALSNSFNLIFSVIGLLFPLSTALIMLFNLVLLIAESVSSRDARLILSAYLAVVAALLFDILCYSTILTIPGYSNYGAATTIAVAALYLTIFTFIFKPAWKKYLAGIDDYNRKDRELNLALARLEEDYKRTDNAYFETIKRLSIVAEYRDLETGSHIRRVGFYVKVLAELLGMDKNQVELLQYASYMHDVGKIGIPDKILFKEGPLTEEEWLIMKSHTAIGSDIFHDTESDVLKKAQEIALYHHERYDGSGYPFGLQGEEIPLSGQIMAIADIYDALRSERPYKAGYSHEEAIRMMSAASGRVNRKQFSPAILELFLANDSLFDIIYNSDFTEMESELRVNRPAPFSYSRKSSLNVV